MLQLNDINGLCIDERELIGVSFNIDFRENDKQLVLTGRYKYRRFYLDYNNFEVMKKDYETIMNAIMKGCSYSTKGFDKAVSDFKNSKKQAAETNKVRREQNEKKRLENKTKNKSLKEETINKLEECKTIQEYETILGFKLREVRSRKATRYREVNGSVNDIKGIARDYLIDFRNVAISISTFNDVVEAAYFARKS